MEDIINLPSYIKFGFHNSISFNTTKPSEPIFHFKGDGGECLRKYWKYKDKRHFIKGLHEKAIRTLTKNTSSNLLINFYDKFITMAIVTMYMPKFTISVSKILNSTFKKIKNKYVKNIEKESNLFQFLYQETRFRIHFGKTLIQSFLLNKISQTPLCDAYLHKLKITDEKEQNGQLLMAIIFDRYAPDLLNFEFDKDKKIEKETINYAKQINEKYPLKMHFEPVNRVTQEKYSDVNSEENLVSNDIKSLFDKAKQSQKIKKYFLSQYNSLLYKRILSKDVKNADSNLRLIYIVFAICKVLDDITTKRAKKQNIYEFLAED